MSALLESKEEKTFPESWFGKAWDPSLLLLPLLGGSLLGFYYASIEYFPEVAWQASLTYLAVMSAIGALLVVVYGLLLFIPGWIWSEFLIHDHLLQPRMCRENDQPKKVSVLVSFGFPFFLIIASAHVALEFQETWSSLVLVAGVVVSSLIVWSTLCWKSTPGSSEVNRQSLLFSIRTADWKRVLVLLGRFELSSFASICALVIIYSVANQSRYEESGRMLVVCTIVVALTNSLVAFYFRAKQLLSVQCAIGAALLLLALGNVIVKKEARLPSQIMGLFGMGFGHPVTLILKKEAAEILGSEGILGETPAQKPEGANPQGSGSESGVVKIEQAEILSRLGAEYVIRAKHRRFSVPKDMVLSWVVDDPSKENVKVPKGPLALASGGDPRAMR